jgi:high affinity Mn2+ porin
MNWALWESAAWDYPADIVGFTAGAVLEWNTPNTTLHYAVFMDATESNGLRLDSHIDKAHAQIIQYDLRYSLDKKQGTMRIFTFWNQAHMGLYQTSALASYPADITLTREYRSKVGLGVSWDQQLRDDLGVFTRLSWNDGKEEDWAFTEIDDSLALGISLNGGSWNRASDVFAIAYAINGISSTHQKYLSNGGMGLILGDSALKYSPEQIIETYYNFKLTNHFGISADLQYIRNPGYNTKRGPLSVYGIRAQIQL